MVCVMLNFKARKDKADEVVQAITEFVAEVAHNEPKTVYYAYQFEDRVSFVHFMTFPDEASEVYHLAAPYTLRFVDRISPLCEKEPEFTYLSLVKSAHAALK